MPPDVSALAAHASSSPLKPVLGSVPITQGGAAASSTAASVAVPHASPVSLLDPSTGLVVLEFYSAKGDETASLPTKKQLDLYRLNEPSLSVFQPAIHDVTVPAQPATVTSPADAGALPKLA